MSTSNEYFVVPPELHDGLVRRAYMKRGYSNDEATDASRFCHSASRHGIRTHNALKALHLFHGLTEQRQYKTRYKDVGDYLKGEWDDIVVVNADGLTEFLNAEASAAVYEYFKRRNEDIPLKEAMAALEAARRGTAKKSHPLLNVADAPTAKADADVVPDANEN